MILLPESEFHLTGTPRNPSSVRNLLNQAPSFSQLTTNAVAEGVGDLPYVQSVIRHVKGVEPSNLVEADTLAIGFPTCLNYVSSELKRLLDETYYRFRKMEKINRLHNKLLQHLSVDYTKDII